jgi:hypothetical protein
VHNTGATVRCQAPLIRHVNDDADTWADLWKHQIVLGAVPYYMFVERDTGPRNYFEVPLVRTAEIFRQAQTRVSGLARTVRGPSMSATPGKVCVDGIAEIHGEQVIALRFLQARDPDWIGRPFFAKYDPSATWLDHLRPAFGESAFFYEEAFVARKASGETGPWAEELNRTPLPVIRPSELPLHDDEMAPDAPPGKESDSHATDAGPEWDRRVSHGRLPRVIEH